MGEELSAKWKERQCLLRKRALEYCVLLQTNRMWLCLLCDTHKNKKRKRKNVNAVRIDTDDLIPISRRFLSGAESLHS